MAEGAGWSYQPLTRRYALGVGRKSADSRVYPAILLGLAFVFLLLFHSTWSLIIFVPMGLLGIYNLLRPMADGWYVELCEDDLVISLIGTTRVAYRDIESVEQLFPSGCRRSFEMGAVWWGNLFGGAAYQDVDCRVKLSFTRWIWCTLIPPLRIPRPSWAIPMEDPEEFAADVNARIAFATESP